ncbi:MAG: DEAD/DEAH box helicase [Pseudomonadota bacterium]
MTEDVHRWFKTRTMMSAQQYQPVVFNLDVGSDTLSAVVPNSEHPPYVTFARLLASARGQLSLHNTCTCRLGKDCAHVAAMLLKAIESRVQDNSVEPVHRAAGASGMFSWVDELNRVSVAVTQKTPKPLIKKHQLFYVLHWTADGRGFGVTLRKGRYPESAEEWWAIDRALLSRPQFASAEDMTIFQLLWAERTHETGLRAFGLGSRHGNEVLQRMVQTGRLCSADDLSFLQWGDPRPASLGWLINEEGRELARLLPTPEASLILPLPAPCYLDLNTGVLGFLEVEGDPSLLACILALPALAASEAKLLRDALEQGATELPPRLSHYLSDPHARLGASALVSNHEQVPTFDAPLSAVLSLQTLHTHGNRAWRNYNASYSGGFFDVVFPSFRYADIDIRPSEERSHAADTQSQLVSELSVRSNGELVQLVRQHADEEKLMEALAAYGLQKIPAYALDIFGHPPEGAYGLSSDSVWPAFVHEALPHLRLAGWKIEFSNDFRHHAREVDAWEADLVESDNGWLDLDMGIIVDGERLPLAPLLAALFRRDARWLDTLRLSAIDDAELIELKTPNSQRIRVPAGRLKPLAATLIDLFDGFVGGNTLRISRFDAPRLADLNDVRRWQFKGQGDVVALAKQLQAAQASEGVRPIEAPAGLKLALRPYQKEGLAWLQFLREQKLSGILADDMGLGKTAQTLAHLLLEKEAGRLDRPSLIVLPTSLMFNWKNEAQRFAPDLSVLCLHGPERRHRFAEIGAHDVVLTTYPLLWRDAEILQQHPFHLLILDEAQTVKNARSQGAEVIRKLHARHRLCLTGTPLENHLGELWSQFDFLLPGFLGSLNTFTRYWRTPIEKLGDMQRRDLLARRIRPFILRRKKEDVARELPAKTIIVRTVELEGAQRDLYETVRAAMDAKVREEIASKGFSRSQIVILDALLKLRQVCCDPRLVKSLSASRVKERAKLDLLMAMLPEQVEEGRRILLFSQFTSMLSLIESELQAAGIHYVTLTGATEDRETPVRRFQNGEVPVFLISLKAGGIGLNLTAADTVIHYDPWWNPAVENQATDRAHRLGQDKPVFVYKLIVAGSIEEKILALQERKAALAAGILSEDRGGEVKFGHDDIAALFAPLPSMNSSTNSFLARPSDF